MIGIYYNPNLTIQYLSILKTKKNVYCLGSAMVNPHALKQLHDIQTNHTHHRVRIAECKNNLIPSSQFGPINLCQPNI